MVEALVVVIISITVLLLYAAWLGSRQSYGRTSGKSDLKERNLLKNSPHSNPKDKPVNKVGVPRS